MDQSKHEIINGIEKKTGLRFQPVIEAGNLCFRANNPDLRDEFKEYFTAEDLEFYIRSFSGEEVQLPVDTHDFWSRINTEKRNKI